MADEVARHYEEVLGARYTWMLGDLEERAALELSRLESLGARPATSDDALAVDLGCGSGLHTRALLALGYRVRAIDQSEALLAELPGDERVEAVHGDLREADATGAELVACMGDTLTHLADWEQVCGVLELWSPGRALALSFRDLSAPARGLTRPFIVRSDDDRIHTCFLEDEGAHVRVHDLFHERDGHGWRLERGSYRKLRVDPERVIAHLESRGARVAVRREGGLISLLAAR